MADQGDSWKLIMPCTKAEAEDAPLFEAPEEAGWPVIMTSEPDPDLPEEWLMEAYFDHEPSQELVAKVLALVPSSAGVAPRIEHLPAQDWVTMSQAGLEPVHAGRFFVHTPIHRDAIPADAVPFEIDAGLAFGTGQHETTSGCLILLDLLATRGVEARNLIDLGTGTGLLAFAALHLWPQALAIATDIDPISIDVSRDNAVVNHIALGEGPGELALAVADGMAHEAIAARAPYDLVIANILAGPLIDLAPSVCAGVAADGYVILAGLLATQAEKVASAYAAEGVLLEHRIVRGDWACLLLRKQG